MSDSPSHSLSCTRTRSLCSTNRHTETSLPLMKQFSCWIPILAKLDLLGYIHQVSMTDSCMMLEIKLHFKSQYIITRLNPCSFRYMRKPDYFQVCLFLDKRIYAVQGSRSKCAYLLAVRNSNIIFSITQREAGGAAGQCIERLYQQHTHRGRFH